MIHIKSKSEIEQIRECGIISASLFKELEKLIKPGITTLELDKFAEDYIMKKKAKPSFKGYSGFPLSICASVNEEIIHGIPCKRKLKEGDIIGIDVGVEQSGLISDSAKTFSVGVIDKEIIKLIERTEKALYIGISKMCNGVEINRISGAIEDYISQFNYGIVKDYCGHGVGFRNHEDPEVPNYRVKGGNKRIKTGTVIAIEPMINLGDSGNFVLEDGWTVVTIDGKFSAHFEHTIAITEDGFDILTIDPDHKKGIEEKYFGNL